MTHWHGVTFSQLIWKIDVTAEVKIRNMMKHYRSSLLLSHLTDKVTGGGDKTKNKKHTHTQPKNKTHHDKYYVVPLPPSRVHTCRSIFSHLSWNLSWASRVNDGEGIFPSPLWAANAANLQENHATRSAIKRQFNKVTARWESTNNDNVSTWKRTELYDHQLQTLLSRFVSSFPFTYYFLVTSSQVKSVKSLKTCLFLSWRLSLKWRQLDGWAQRGNEEPEGTQWKQFDVVQEDLSSRGGRYIEYNGCIASFSAYDGYTQWFYRNHRV